MVLDSALGFSASIRSRTIATETDPLCAFLPLPGCLTVLSEVERYAEITARITHNHPEGIKGAKATAAAIYLARMGQSKDDIQRYIEQNYSYELNQTLEELRSAPRLSLRCQETVPEAIMCF